MTNTVLVTEKNHRVGEVTAITDKSYREIRARMEGTECARMFIGWMDQPCL